jgi:hypothetical protein
LPIEKAQFEQGRIGRALYSQIFEFLTKNRGRAYTDAEIAQEMRLVDSSVQALESLGWQLIVLLTLDNLIRDGKVAVRIVGDGTKKMGYFIAV